MALTTSPVTLLPITALIVVPVLPAMVSRPLVLIVPLEMAKASAWPYS